jgi:hypothetical protein
MNILLWHVHGAWTTAFVSGDHTYLVPVVPDRGPDGRGLARTYDWPGKVVECTPAELATVDIDVMVLQRPHELELAANWTGRRRPMIYVEHNTPRENVPDSRHPMADRPDIHIVHVTDFNSLFWDCGNTPTSVIEHGIPDPGHLYTGSRPRLAVVVNEPIRRGRVTGTDLLPAFAALAGVDVYGMGVLGLPGHLGVAVSPHEDLPQRQMHAALAQRRAYLHLNRWTSLGLSLLEAMSLGMPVLALAATASADAIPAGAGICSPRVGDLIEAARWLLTDHSAAVAMGNRARAVAQERFALSRFLTDWNELLERVS